MFEQWFSSLQLLHEDLWKVLMGQVSTPTIWPARGGKEERRREYKKKKEAVGEGDRETKRKTPYHQELIL